MCPRRHVSTGSPFEPKIGISRAVRTGNVIAVTGTAPLGPDGKTVSKGNAAAQARRCLEIIQSAIEGLGGKAFGRDTYPNFANPHRRLGTGRSSPRRILWQHPACEHDY